MRNSSLLALTVTVDDRQNLSMRMATSSGTTYTGLGADGTTWTALGPVREASMRQVGTRRPILPRADVTGTKPSYTVPYI